jgi:hypothetical protein
VRFLKKMLQRVFPWIVAGAAGIGFAKLIWFGLTSTCRFREYTVTLTPPLDDLTRRPWSVKTYMFQIYDGASIEYVNQDWKKVVDDDGEDEEEQPIRAICKRCFAMDGDGVLLRKDLEAAAKK